MKCRFFFFHFCFFCLKLTWTQMSSLNCGVGVKTGWKTSLHKKAIESLSQAAARKFSVEGMLSSPTTSTLPWTRRFISICFWVYILIFSLFQGLNIIFNVALALLKVSAHSPSFSYLQSKTTISSVSMYETLLHFNPPRLCLVLKYLILDHLTIKKKFCIMICMCIVLWLCPWNAIMQF